MTLPGKIIEAPPCRGFDCNQRVSLHTASKFREAGFRFAVRYVGRRKMASFDISEPEAHDILKAGLGLMLVQHVENPAWVPTGGMGAEYGHNAGLFAASVGYHLGAMVWCDLEGVKLQTDHRDVIGFCNNWYAEVAKLGFTPGLYVGYDPGLTAPELYYRLKFEHYWSAYNLNRDQFPAVRGVQMKQGLEKIAFETRYDPDDIQADKKGGLPLMLVDLEWTAE